MPLPSIDEQYAAQLASLTEAKGRGSSVAAMPVTTPTQVLIPTSSWDWPVATEGSISNQQFEFANTIPLSSLPHVEYAPSGDSFTGNYRAFLSTIESQKFPFNNLLVEAKNKIRTPTGNPASDPAPAGWTKVQIAGINRWKPIWTLSDSGQGWKQKIESGAIHNPGTVSIILSRDQGTAAGENAIRISNSSITFDVSAQFEKIQIYAAAWGQIAIYPGSWFESNMIQLGRKYTKEEDAFFNPTTGLLRSRITSFYAAYKPKITLYPNGSPNPALLAEMGKSSVEIMGISAKVLNIKKDASGAIELESLSPYPSIVGVILEVY